MQIGIINHHSFAFSALTYAASDSCEALSLLVNPREISLFWQNTQQAAGKENIAKTFFFFITVFIIMDKY